MFPTSGMLMILPRLEVNFPENVKVAAWAALETNMTMAAIDARDRATPMSSHDNTCYRSSRARIRDVRSTNETCSATARRPTAPGSGAKPVEVFEFQKRDAADPRPAAQSYTIYMNPVAGGNHVVQVQINGRATVPMMLDTGASDVVIPRAAAQRAGITQHDYRGTQRYSTANGMVEQPAITLREVRVGDATVKMVRGSISDSMEIGLLGASFLRNFEYSIRGSELILVPRE